MRKNQIILDSEKDLNIRTGIITNIYRNINRATVQIDNGPILNKIEFFYHCSPNNTEDGSSAFYTNDKVLVANSDGVDYIIGFENLKPRSCLQSRFFVKIKKDDSFKYYGLSLVNEEGNYDLTATEATNTNILEKMLLTPYKNAHTQTKAFMLTIDSEKERWVAAPQLLTKDRVQQFLPLNFPATQNPPEKLPLYPDPIECSGGSPGLNHSCPPNRFYCNTTDKIMTWYTANEWLICGIILKFDDSGNGTVWPFYYTPADANGQGFNGYWFYIGSPPNVVSSHPEVPAYMITDVDCLDKNKLRVILPWNWRPVTIETEFSSGATIYNDPSSCKHMFWDGSTDGFKQELLAEFTQELDDGSESYIEDVIDNDPQECSGHGSQDSCEDTLREQDAYSKQRIITNFNKHSKYIMYIFNEQPNSESYWTDVDVKENRYEKICVCRWNPIPQTCIGPYCNRYWDDEGNMIICSLGSHRDLDDNLAQKTVHSIAAQWVSPNTASIPIEINRIYVNGYGEQRTNKNFGGTSTSDFMNMCYWRDWIGGARSEWMPLMTAGKCFKGYPMPGDDWAITGDDIICGDAGHRRWEREAISNDYTETPINKYKIDGIIEIDSSKYDRTYYLDDRSTDDSHGIIVAAKDYTPASEGNPEQVHDWKIHWAKSGTSYSDITTDILTALNITKEQLYGIGLI